MKKTLVLFACMLFLLSTALVAQNKYVGSVRCKGCHNVPAKGEQFKKWSDSKHSKAMAALKGDDAKNEKCLKCHSTAAGVDAKLLDGLTQAEGVSCESCHGAGSAYKSPTIMKDVASAKKNGLVIPDEKTCLKCHGKGLGNPNEKPFDFKTYFAKIAHPIKK